MPEQIRVLVADDHPLLREGIRRLVEATPDMVIVGEAKSGDELIALARDADVDVAVTDIGMPGGPFQEVIAAVASRDGVRVVVLSVHAEEAYALQAMKAGAAGYVTKEHSPDELIEAIRRVHAGGRYVSATLGERLASLVAGTSIDGGLETLSTREFEVFRLLSDGRSLRDIAGELDINAKTVSTYRTRVLAKLGVHNNAELVRYALRHGVIE